MTNKQSSDNQPTRGQVGEGAMRPPVALPATRQEALMVRLFWD
jgi:hypothetical protein